MAVVLYKAPQSAITTLALGLPISVPLNSIFLTTSMPLVTLPNTFMFKQRQESNMYVRFRLLSSRIHYSWCPLALNDKKQVNSGQRTVCFPFNQGVAAVQIKNWLPCVLGPALAMESVPGPPMICTYHQLCLSSCREQKFIHNYSINKLNRRLP